MKKLISILVLVFAFTVFANAQRVYTPAADTLQGNETVNLEAITSSSSAGTLAIQALCTQLGGTSDGTLLLKGSVDGVSYMTINSVAGKFDFYPNDTLTITNGAVFQVVITNSPFKYYRITGGGTASDTTLITQKYVPKLK